ncbi:hypothetical protein TNCV_366401 [Trichonephila clavipes]|nr:hypothetical protein TNCV_366401 [Trichonephila clavipes]
MGPLFIVRTQASVDTQTGRHNGQKRTGTPLTIGQACLKRILSPRLVSRERDNRTRVVTRKAKGDFCDLPMRRDEGRVVDSPLVFKRGLGGGEGRRALDRENLRRALKKETWTEIRVERKRKTMNAGGVGELE